GGLRALVDDLEVVGEQRADRHDDRRRAAREGADDLTGCRALAPLVDRQLALLDGEPAVPRELEDRRERDALENRVGFGSDETAVAGDEHEVHAAELLDVLPVEEEDLLAALLVRL